MSTVTQRILNYPQLPYPLQVGNLRWSEKLEDYPSGEILYKGCTLSLANAIAASYPDLYPITIEGIGFVVAAAGVSIKRSRYGRGDIEAYDVTVQLESIWKAKCQRKVNLNPFIQRDLFSKFKVASGVNVGAIAAFLGIAYNGPSIFYSPDQTETTFEEILKTNCRRLGCFIRFTDVDSIKLVGIDGVGTWSYPDSIVIDNGSNRRDPVLPVIDRVGVTGAFSRDPFDQEDKLLLPIEPKVEIVKQGQDAHLLSPAEASGKLKSLDSNFDVSGPKKVYTETTLVDGIVTKEVTKIYGYMYKGVQIAQFTTTPYSFKLEGSPILYWQQVEETTVEYTYKSIPSFFTVSVQNENKAVQLYVNPDSANVLSVFGGRVSLNNAKYLIGSTTTGWKYVRFQKESDSVLESKFSTPPAVSDTQYQTLRYRAELCDFRKIIISGKSGFEIDTLRSLYPQTTPTPFTLDIQKYSELSPDVISRADIPPKYKVQNGVTVLDESYVVGIVTANPADSEPYWVKSETSFKSAFAYTKSAKFNPYLPAVTRREGDLTPEYIFTGDEAYSSVVRKVVEETGNTFTFSSAPSFGGQKDKAEKYEEVVLNDNAQGANFLEAASDAVKEIKKGKPPIAQVQLKQWGNAAERAKARGANPINVTYSKFYASSDLVGAYPADIVQRYTDSDSIDLPNAKTQEEARLTLVTDLRMSGMGNIISSKKIAWHYPQMRAGDRINFSSGQLRANTVSHNLEFRGLQNGQLMVVSEGTQVECGYDRDRTVTLTQANFDRNSDSQIAPNVRVTVQGQPTGEFVYNTSQRRSFNVYGI
jgi:hypothetical protein